MVHLSRLGLLTVLLTIHGSVRADPPRLTGTSRLGIQRGKLMEMTFQGSALDDAPRLVAPFGFQLEESAGHGSGQTRWTVRLAVDGQTAVGVYPIRVVTDSGVSNPILFAVGQVPQIREVEPNNRQEMAQPISSPVVVEGECAGNDVDFFRFAGRRGDRIVVDAVCARLGSGVDPMIRLTTADRRLVASADDTPGLFTDGYLTATLPEDGEYVLEFCDSRFAGTGRAVYRLLIGSIPFAGEVFPLSLPRGQNTALELRGGTLSGERLFAVRTPSDPLLSMYQPRIPARLLGDPIWADSELDVELPTPILLGTPLAIFEPADHALKLPPLTSPATILGRLSKAGESDEFTIKAPPGSKHEVRVEAWGLGSALDGQLRIFGKGGQLLGENDDGRAAGRRRPGGGGGRNQGPVSTDPVFDLTMPEGQSEVKVVVKDLMDRGGVGFIYRLIVTPVGASFQLSPNEDHVAIPRGGTALVSVVATRAGYNGPIALDVRGVPENGGVTVLAGTIPAGQTGGVVGLKAALESTFGTRDVQVVGKRRGWPGRRGVQDDRFRTTDDLDTRLRHGRDDPQLRAADSQPHLGGDQAQPDHPEPRGVQGLGGARGHGRGPAPGRASRSAEGEVQALRNDSGHRPRRGRVGDRRGRDTCQGQDHGDGGRAARLAQSRPRGAGHPAGWRPAVSRESVDENPKATTPLQPVAAAMIEVEIIRPPARPGR